MKKGFCANCRGPLKVEPGAETLVCGYCGHQQSVGRKLRSSGSEGKGRSFAALWVFIALITAAGIGIPIWLATRAVSDVVSNVTKATSAARTEAMKATRKSLSKDRPTPVAEAEPRFAPGDLANAPDDSWFLLDTKGMPGQLDALDPIACFEWFQNFAKAWSPDAELDSYGLAIDNLSATTGLLDATRNGRVDVRYFSKVRFEAAEKLAEVSDERPPTLFRIWVEDGKVRAMKSIDRSSRSRRKLPGAPTLTCSSSQLMEVAQKSTKLPKRPFYSARLSPSGRQWMWRVSADRGSVAIKPDQCK